MFKDVVTVRASDDWGRLLNLCRNKSIDVWDVRRDGDECTFVISAADFDEVSLLCQKCSANVSVVAREGLRFRIERHGRNYPFVLGLAIAIALVWVMSLHVWEVSFEGNVYYTSSRLLEYMADKGVYRGAMLNAVDCARLEADIRNDYPDITWVSIEKSGTCIKVHIKEYESQPEVSRDAGPCRDLLSPIDGEVWSIITRQGTPLVEKGANVLTGDVLVSGELKLTDDYGNETGVLHGFADADIYLKTVYEYRDFVNVEYIGKIYSGNTSRYYNLYIGDKHLKIGFCPTGELVDVLEERITPASLAGVRLSFAIYKSTGLEYELCSTTYTKDEMKRILEDNYEKYIKNLQEKGIQILSESVTMNDSGVDGSLCGELEVIVPVSAG